MALGLYVDDRTQFSTIDGTQAAVLSEFTFLVSNSSNPKAVFSDQLGENAISNVQLTNDRGQFDTPIYFDEVARVTRFDAGDIFRSDDNEVLALGGVIVSGEWDASTTYSINDIVTEAGIGYKSRVDNNLNNTPSTSFDEWANTSGIGKETFPIRAGDMVPSATNGAVREATQLSSGVMIDSFSFDPIAVEFIQFNLEMPGNWDFGSVDFSLRWSHGSTTVNFGVVWRIKATAFGDNESLDVAFTGGSQRVAEGGVTNGLFITSNFALPIEGNPSQSRKFVIFEVERNATSSSDDLAIDARLIGVDITYTTVSSVVDD